MQTRASLMLCLSVALTVGCATEGRFVWVSDVPIISQNMEAIGPRDTLLISVKNQSSLSGEFLVGDHGNYPQPTLGTIPVAGKTTDVVARDLQDRLKNIVINPEVSVSIVKVASIRVNVVGEVKTPGAYELLRGRGLIPALAAAGWLTEFADRDRIYVIRSQAGGSLRVRFRARDLTAAEPHATGFRLEDGDIVVVD